MFMVRFGFKLNIIFVKGRGHEGYLVYLSYQLVENVTFQQIIGETILYSSDIRWRTFLTLSSNQDKSSL